MSANIGEICDAPGDPCIAEDVNEEFEINVEMAAGGEPGLTPLNKSDEVKNNGVEEGKEAVKPTLQSDNERDDYKKKLDETEAKLSALQASYDAIISGKDDEMSLRRQIEDLKNNLKEADKKLNDRSRLINNQECQISALSKQVSSLKEVISITKSLLEIRNLEVKNLQEDVDSMEKKITVERTRHDDMINRMNATTKLNAELKNEYETQLRLFQDLRGKYEQKVCLLTAKDKLSEKNSDSTGK